MGGDNLQVVPKRNQGVVFSSSGVKVQFLAEEIGVRNKLHGRCFFASVSQVGQGFGMPLSHSNTIESSVSTLLASANMHLKLVSVAEPVLAVEEVTQLELGEDVGEEEVVRKNKTIREKFRWKITVANPALRRLLSGAIAGVVSRTAVAPMETIKTHLMVGSGGHSTIEVFNDIMKHEGWTGLFRGNLVNVIRVAPGKAIELFAYDTVMTQLTPDHGTQPELPIPASSIAGAIAGVSSTLCMYPLELLKTRITVQRGVYNNLLDALVKITREEGAGELYRGLTPSLIGVMPYAAANYFAYDALRKAYKRVFKKDEIGSVATLLIGSAAGAFSSTATFPLEVARKYMQAGALNGRQYQNMLHALVSIIEHEGLSGLYRGLAPSYMKLVPAAGISFMCYEACKRTLLAEENS